MRVSILTVGDELLAGDIENTNATWLADRLTSEGSIVREIVVLPDERDRIRTTVADHSDRFDAVLVTGGLGSTPDDVTVDGVADGLHRDVVLDDRTHQLVKGTVGEIQEEYPEFDFDVERGSERPEGSTPIPNDEGIAPGFIVENVFVLPGIPSEMKPIFERVSDDLQGSLYSRSVLSTEPESHLNEILRTVDEEFDVFVGCYPSTDKEMKRIKVRGNDEDSVHNARSWLLEQSEVDGTVDGQYPN